MVLSSVPCSLFKQAMEVSSLAQDLRSSAEARAFCSNMALEFGKVKAAWESLCWQHGMEGMQAKAEFGHECLRETLMQFRPVFADKCEHYQAMTVVAQLLTVFNTMTLTDLMKTEVTRATCWVEYRNILPHVYRDLSATRAEVMDQMVKGKSEHVWDILAKSDRELSSLVSEMPEDSTYILKSLAEVQELLRTLMGMMHPAIEV